MTEGRADLSHWREPQALIETGALETSLGMRGLRIVDCTTWLKPAEPGDDAPYRVVPGRAGYDAAHIPGAVFLDIQGTISDPDTRLRFMAPSAERFADAMGGLGIGDESRVVLYAAGSIMWADTGLVDAARVRLRPCGGARWRLGEVEGGGAPRILRTGTVSSGALHRDAPAGPLRGPRVRAFPARRWRHRHGECARARVSSRRRTEPLRASGTDSGERQRACGPPPRSVQRSLRAVGRSTAAPRKRPGSPRTATWWRIAAAASPPPSASFSFTSSATATSPSTTGRWASGRTTPASRSKPARARARPEPNRGRAYRRRIPAPADGSCTASLSLASVFGRFL